MTMQKELFFPFPKILRQLKLIIIICFGLVTSCSVTKESASRDTNLDEEPKILFLKYVIKKDANDKIATIQKKVVIRNGYLKPPSPSFQETKPGNLICKQISGKNIELYEVSIGDPLTKDVEYLNEVNTFEKKRIYLDSANVFIRMPLDPKTQYIRLYRLNDSNSMTLLTDSEL